MIAMIGMVLMFSMANAQSGSVDAKPSEENTAMNVEWTSSVHDFKEIPVKKPVTAVFEFTNKGKEPVSIARVRSSCGCTVAAYSKKPVLPGGTGTVSGTFDAAKYGAFNKALTVSMSDNSQHRLTLKGTVGKKPPKAGQQKADTDN